MLPLSSQAVFCEQEALLKQILNKQWKIFFKFNMDKNDVTFNHLDVIQKF